MIAASVLSTPVGRLQLIASDEALLEIRFERSKSWDPLFEPTPPGRNAVLGVTSRQLAEYFTGSRRHFDLPLQLTGTDFQRRVWCALLQVPFGETCSYKELATRIGRPSSVRAEAAANGANPIPLIVPCHRVIGADGSLVGFGGGLHVKSWLLELEGARHCCSTQQDLFQQELRAPCFRQAEPSW